MVLRPLKEAIAKVGVWNIGSYSMVTITVYLGHKDIYIYEEIDMVVPERHMFIDC